MSLFALILLPLGVPHCGRPWRTPRPVNWILIPVPAAGPLRGAGTCTISTVEVHCVRRSRNTRALHLHPRLHLSHASVTACRARSDTRMTSGKLPALGTEREEQESLWSTEKTSEAVDRREMGVTSPLGARSGTCKSRKQDWPMACALSP